MENHTLRQTAAQLALLTAVFAWTPTATGQGGGVTADGWQVRLDDSRADVNDLSFRPMRSGVHVTTGPHAIFWRPTDTASGMYAVQATFTQTTPSSHPNAFGVFFGGQDLAGDGQRYTYFLIREGGQFLVKQRQGAETTEVTSGWASHAAVNALEDGQMTNTLEAQVAVNHVRFLVNGTEVARLPKAGLDVDGIAGLRFSHQLDVQVSSFLAGFGRL